MPDRKDIVLAAIIQTYIKHAKPVGSAHLLEEFNLGVSPATVRNDMMWLEKHGMISQPFTSAGRVPTDVGLRKYVDEMMNDVQVRIPKDMLVKLQEISEMRVRVKEEHIQVKLKEAVSVLADITQNVSFATLPWVGDAYYLGLANILMKPEFHDSVKVSTVVQFLEDREHFIDFLEDVAVDEDIRVFIGRENILEAIQSCSLIAVRYEFNPEMQGVMGILGPTRMNYSRNIAALQAVIEDLI